MMQPKVNPNKPLDFGPINRLAKTGCDLVLAIGKGYLAYRFVKDLTGTNALKTVGCQVAASLGGFLITHFACQKLMDDSQGDKASNIKYGVSILCGVLAGKYLGLTYKAGLINIAKLYAVFALGESYITPLRNKDSMKHPYKESFARINLDAGTKMNIKNILYVSAIAFLAYTTYKELPGYASSSIQLVATTTAATVGFVSIDNVKKLKGRVKPHTVLITSILIGLLVGKLAKKEPVFQNLAKGAAAVNLSMGLINGFSPASSKGKRLGGGEHTKLTVEIKEKKEVKK